MEVSSSSDSEEEGQAFYVGGSERSGQQVIGPPRHKGKPSGDLIGDMFKSAREYIFLTFVLFISQTCNIFCNALDMVQKFWKRELLPQQRETKPSKELDIV